VHNSLFKFEPAEKLKRVSSTYRRKCV